MGHQFKTNCQLGPTEVAVVEVNALLLREKAQKSQTKAMIKQLLKDPLTGIRITTLYNIQQTDMEVSDGELETTGSRTRCLGGDSGRRRWIC